MKKIISFVLSLVIAISLLFSFSLNIFAENHKCIVDDKADVLSESEEAELLNAIIQQSSTKNLSISIITFNESFGKSTMVYTDDYYDVNIAEENGILLAIDFDNRQVYINTVGNAITNISDSEIDNILDSTYKYCSNGEYYKFFNVTLDKVLKAYSGENYKSTSVTNPWVPDLVSIIATVVVMAIVVITLLVVHNKNNKAPSANEYINSSFEVNSVTPIFLGIHEEVIHDFYKESSSGGGSSHMSSGGVSHGGGGHSF
ncbi:MAG: TPM domain-containing protein [Oscillospiraceae bacterium]|nr:TPM domain-containing protein [Oscillospiraceae bacterium]